MTLDAPFGQGKTFSRDRYPFRLDGRKIVAKRIIVDQQHPTFFLKKKIFLPLHLLRRMEGLKINTKGKDQVWCVCLVDEDRRW